MGVSFCVFEEFRSVERKACTLQQFLMLGSFRSRQAMVLALQATRKEAYNHRPWPLVHTGHGVNVVISVVLDTLKGCLQCFASRVLFSSLRSIRRQLRISQGGQLKI